MEPRRLHVQRDRAGRCPCGMNNEPRGIRVLRTRRFWVRSRWPHAPASRSPRPAERVSHGNRKASTVPYPGPYFSGHGADLLNLNCSICHSADFVNGQAHLPLATWKAEVLKMKNVFHAPIGRQEMWMRWRRSCSNAILRRRSSPVPGGRAREWCPGKCLTAAAARPMFPGYRGEPRRSGAERPPGRAPTRRRGDP